MITDIIVKTKTLTMSLFNIADFVSESIFGANIALVVAILDFFELSEGWLDSYELVRSSHLFIKLSILILVVH